MRYKILKDALEMKLNAYLGLEEEFEELIAIPDPFESDHFVYCPDAIPVSLARGFRDKPKIIINAKYILQAVYEGKNNVEVPEKDAISNHDFQAAIDLAKLSNPIAAGINKIAEIITINHLCLQINSLNFFPSLFLLSYIQASQFTQYF